MTTLDAGQNVADEPAAGSGCLVGGRTPEARARKSSRPRALARLFPADR